MLKTYVEDVLSAIASVRARAKIAMEQGNFVQTTRLMEDLRALELCLEIESQKLIDEMYKMENSA